MNENTLIEILRAAGVPEEADIRMESRLKEDLSLSSFSMMVILSEIERIKKKAIDPARIVRLETVRDMYMLLSDLDAESESQR